jgi:predicted helicase
MNFLATILKMSNKRKAQVFHFDLYGKREEKYDFLNQQSIESIQWAELEVKEPNFYFKNKDFKHFNTYNSFVSVTEFFNLTNAGLATEFDEFVIKDTFTETSQLLNNLNTLTPKEIQTLYGIETKKIDKIERAINDIQDSDAKIVKIDYRPFDVKYTLYTGNANGIMGRPRNGVMQHMLNNNFSLLTCRQQTTSYFHHAFISKYISERCSVSLQTGEVNYIFPLYLNYEITAQTTLDQITERTPNLNMQIVGQIAENLGLQFTNEKEQTQGTFAPIDILDYIYAVLHSPTYREKYKEFLKIDFPRVPYPKDPETFWNLVALGRELRQIHLLESPKVSQLITTYPITGNNIITKPRFESSESETHQLASSSARELISSSAHQLGTVWINDEQYFDRVPIIAWNFYIGGYQPAQKWLKDRKGRELSFEDILHYQKIIVALFETDRLMKEIDKITFE